MGAGAGVGAPQIARGGPGTTQFMSSGQRPAVFNPDAQGPGAPLNPGAVGAPIGATPSWSGLVPFKDNLPGIAGGVEAAIPTCPRVVTLVGEPMRAVMLPLLSLKVGHGPPC